VPVPNLRGKTSALLTVLLLLAGCSAADQDSARDRAERVLADARQAVEEAVQEAKDRNAQESGSVERRAPSQQDVLRTDTRTAFDYAQYQNTVESVLGSLEEYWSQALPDTFGVAYRSPSRYVYYRSEEDPGPRCGNQAAPPKNAFYCPPGDFIAWDESGLLIPYYVSAGDFAAAFVLAHEFGHAMQFRLPRQEALGVLAELQADCFAGAWSRHVQDQGQLEAGDLDEATLAVFSARDVPGTPFTDPRAHGSGFERTRAFTDGYEGGPARCYPAPQEAWLVQQ
jgi:predicted metalloprotease